MQIKEQDSIYDGQYISIILLQQIGDIMFVICKKNRFSVFFYMLKGDNKSQLKKTRPFFWKNTGPKI